MPQAAPRACATPGCPRVAEYPHRRCVECRKGKQRERARTKAGAAQFYASSTWKRIREAHLMAEPLCRHCKALDILTPATEVDHIDGNYRNNLMSNHQSLCKPCHSRKTVAENGGFADCYNRS